MKSQAPCPKIAARDISVTYESGRSRVPALTGIDLTVEEGEFVCILGPSGCGKSTLLHMMAGLIQPTTGGVLIDGAPVGGPSPDRTMVFQRDAVFPWFTVEENISYGPRMRGVPRRDRETLAAQLVRLVSLDGFEKRYPKELSGGMRKRVDVARAYANSPSLLLMDEPFGALDELTKENMQIDLQRLWMEKGGTICFVTHSIEEAIFLADRILVMTPRPGTISHEFRVEFARPRRAELKTTAEFQEVRRALLASLATERRHPQQ